MKKIIFKTICLVLVFAHFSVVCLRDASFAAEQAAPAQDTNTAATSSNSGTATPQAVSDTPRQKAQAAAAVSSQSVNSAQGVNVRSLNLGTLQNFQSDPFTGRANFSLGIEVPAGRKGLQPNLSLAYSSGAGNGSAGLGWSLEIGAIERSTKKGSPHYNSSDIFIFNSGSGSEELVSAGGNAYRSKNEAGFMRFVFSGSSWEVTDKTGTKFYFGSSPASRQEDGSRIFKWCLDKVQDLHGNYLNVAYAKDAQQVYPLKIEYTGNENTGLAPLCSVEFVLEERPDILSSYRPGFKITTRKRLSEILVKANANPVRKYKLKYLNRDSGQRSLLASLAQYGNDNTTRLPAVTFDYQEEFPGWTVAEGKSFPGPDFDYSVRVFDANNDGFLDIIKAYDHFGSIEKAAYLGQPDLNWQESSSWISPVVIAGRTAVLADGPWFDNAIQIADVNGDGWQDLVQYFRRDGTHKGIYLNNKRDGWSLDNTWTNSLPNEACFLEDYQSTGWVMVDINADGFADLLKATASEKIAYLNTGSGWQRDSVWNLAEGNFLDSSTQLADLNADGLTDIFIIDNSSSRAYLNNGSGWVRDDNFNLDLSGFAKNKIQLADINSDGLADIVISESGKKRTYINTYSDGNTSSWQEKTDFRIPEYADLALGSRLADARGRFLTDVVSHSSGENKIYLNNNIYLPGLLIHISNGIGGSIQINYQTSSGFDNSGDDGLSDLPFPVYVVESVRLHDRVNQDNPDIVTRYEYRGGFFDSRDRDFRGFAYARTIDSEGNYSESYFHQDSIYKGKLYRQEARDSQGNLYRKTENTWQHREISPGVNFAYLAQSDNFTYEAAADYKQTRVKFSYDAYGNPAQVISEGDVEVSGDEKTQVTAYTYNTAAWLLGLPKTTQLLDSQGNKVSEKRFYYDGANTLEALPLKGLLTKEEAWLKHPLAAKEEWLSSAYGYDSCANLISVTDALGRSVRTEYDALTSTYPVKVTNALGQSAQTVYYGINEPLLDQISGSGLFGQVKSTQDANQQKSYQVYDALGRLIKAIGPYDTLDAPGATYEYYFPDSDATDDYTKLFIPDRNFDGRDDYLVYSDSGDWNLGSADFTVDLWIKFHQLPANQFGLLQQYQDYANAWGLSVTSNQLFLYSSLAGGWDIAFNNPALYPFSARSWHHLAVSRQSNTLRLFADGKRLAAEESAKTLPDLNAPLWVGRQNYGIHTWYLDAAIEDFRLSKGTCRYNQDFTPSRMSRAAEVIRRVKADYSASGNYLSTLQFYDGLGRVSEIKSPAQSHPASGEERQIISGIVTYNSRGQAEKKYLPYFAPASGDYLAPDYQTPYTQFTYDALGRVAQVTNPDSTYASTNYAPGAVTTTDENGHYKTQYLDAYGRINKVEEHNGSSVYTTTYQYDTQGNLSETLDNQGNRVQIWYDSLGRKVSMDDPDMGVWSYTYDKVGNLKQQTDAKGQVLEFIYDALNRLITKKGLSPQTSIAGQAKGLSLALATYYYDSGSYGVGRLSKITDLSGSTEFFYDKSGREIKSIKTVDSVRWTVSREYDALDRLTKLTYPDGEAVTYTYNPQGIEEVKGLSPQTSITRQSRGLSLTYVSNIDYSPTGQLLKIEYGNGSATTYAYDPQTLRLNSLLTESAQGRLQDLSYQFDPVGNITHLTDRVNTATQSFLYDDLGRLIQAQGSYGAFTYTYDSIGNMLNKEGVELAYGKDSRLPHAVTRYGSVCLDYDANGNLVKKGSLVYTYDAENRLTKVEDSPQSQPQSFSLTLQPGWNFFSLPLVPADARVASVLASISGKYSQVSRYNPTAKKFEHYVGNAKYDQFSAFEYGRGYQIHIPGSSALTLSITGTPVQAGSIRLKPGCNLIFCPRSSETPVEEALKPLKLGIDYTKVLRYNRATSFFEKYDASSREFSTLKPGEGYYLYCSRSVNWVVDNSRPRTTFVYDGDGGRVRKGLSPQGTVPEQWTTYIGSLFEKDSSGAATKHIFAGATRVCTISTNSTNATNSTHYYHSDHLGSSNVITDQSGKQVGLCEYTPYGSLSKGLSPQGTVPAVKHLFTGKEMDASTGLYFYGARYYDPQIGRFITADTIVQSPYDPQSLNRYSYCRNNPINYVDPTGHKWSWKKFWNSFAGGFLGAVVGILTYGAGFSLMAAGFLGGLSGGALTGGLEGGWKGALIGGAIGGALGAFGGWGVDKFGWGFGAGMLLAGAGVAGVTDRWDSFAGGISGAIGGTLAGATYLSAGAPGSHRSQLASYLDKEKQAQKALSVNAKDSEKVTMQVGSRKAGNAPFGKAEHQFTIDTSKNVTEMGAGWDGKIKTFKYNLNDRNSVIEAVLTGPTPQNTLDAISAKEIQWSDWTSVSKISFDTMVSGHEMVWSGESYVGGSFNSNYAVNSWIYGSGGEIKGLTTNRPSFSGSKYYE